YHRAGEIAKVVLAPQTAMALQLVATKVSLRGLEFGGAHDDGFVGAREGVGQQLQAGSFLEVLHNVPQKDEIVGRQFLQEQASVAEMNLIVKVTVHFGQIPRMALDAVDAN